MITCVCNNISDRQIREAAERGLTTIPQLRNELGLGNCCGKCVSSAKVILNQLYNSDGKDISSE